MTKRIIVPLLGLLGACGSPQQPPPAPTVAHTAHTAPSPTPEPVATTEPLSDPPGPKVLSQQEIETFCSESCERNGKLCAEIDVPGCTKNCQQAFGAVRGFCPGRLGAFVECVKQDPLRCKAGAKIRTENCEDESAAITMCLGLYSVPEMDRCVMQCEEFGQCEIVDGVCMATEASCAKLEKCKAKGCKVVDALCEANE
ncbi:MAG: hypothetical protein AB7K71_34675 [Polyangiaceae bacterium]